MFFLALDSSCYKAPLIIGYKKLLRIDIKKIYIKLLHLINYAVAKVLYHT